MKYIEELSGGDCFELSNDYYIVSKDFDNRGQVMCLRLSNGFPKWFKSSTIVNHIELFTLDKDNNIIGIKERKRDDVSTQT